MTEEKGFIKKILGLGEEKMSDLTNELLSNPKFASALGKTIQKAMETKGKFDKNIQVILSAVNMPTKEDYDRMADRVNSLNKNLNELELRIDDLIERIEKHAMAKSPKAAKKGGAAKTRPKAKAKAKPKAKAGAKAAKKGSRSSKKKK